MCVHTRVCTCVHVRDLLDISRDLGKTAWYLCVSPMCLAWRPNGCGEAEVSVEDRGLEKTAELRG